MASRRTTAVSLLALAHASEKSGWFLNDDGLWEHTDGTIYGGGKTDAGKDDSGADDGKTSTGKDNSGAADGKADADGKDGSGADDGGKSGWTLNDEGEWVSDQQHGKGVISSSKWCECGEKTPKRQVCRTQ